MVNLATFSLLSIATYIVLQGPWTLKSFSKTAMKKDLKELTPGEAESLKFYMYLITFGVVLIIYGLMWLYCHKMCKNCS